MFTQRVVYMTSSGGLPQIHMGSFDGSSGHGGPFGRPAVTTTSPTPGTAHYATLGIERTATQETVRAAYLAAARATHTDLHGGDSQAFVNVKAAYDVLSDVHKRAAYDVGGDDAVRELTRSPPCVSTQLRVPLAAVATGATVPVRVQRCSLSLPLGSRGGYTPNRDADGRPVAPETVTVSVAVPAGAVDGMTVEVVGEGHLDAETGKRGHVHVVLAVDAQDGPYIRQDANLYTEATLKLYRVLLGGTVVLPPLFGVPVHIHLPRGCLQVLSSRIAVPGKGLRVFGTDLVGDLVVRLHVQLPPALTPQRALDVATLLEAPAEELLAFEAGNASAISVGGGDADGATGTAAITAEPFGSPHAERRRQHAAQEGAARLQAHQDQVAQYAAGAGVYNPNADVGAGHTVGCAQQ